MSNFTLLLGSLALLSAACGPDVVSTRSDDSGTTIADGSSGSTGSPTPGPSTSGVDSTGTPATDTGAEPPGVSFVDDMDLGPEDDCDPFAQECAAGHKCTWWSPDGSGALNGTRCVPMVDDPVEPGAPCTAELPLGSGLDDCALAALCWDVDSRTGQGTCVPLCTGDWSNPYCEDPETACEIAGDGLSICLPSCDPLLQDECPEGQACYHAGQHFRCGFDASGKNGAYGDPCDFHGQCDPGLTCDWRPSVPACDPGSGTGCCTELCDLEDPQCSDAELGVTCVPWFEAPVPLGYENLGVCVLPSE